jgi:hypothetical protein
MYIFLKSLKLSPSFFPANKKAASSFQEGSFINLPRNILFLLPLYVGGFPSRQSWQVFWLPAPFDIILPTCWAVNNIGIMLITDATTATALHRFPF